MVSSNKNDDDDGVEEIKKSILEALEKAVAGKGGKVIEVSGIDMAKAMASIASMVGGNDTRHLAAMANAASSAAYCLAIACQAIEALLRSSLDEEAFQRRLDKVTEMVEMQHQMRLKAEGEEKGVYLETAARMVEQMLDGDFKSADSEDEAFLQEKIKSGIAQQVSAFIFVAAIKLDKERSLSESNENKDGDDADDDSASDQRFEL